MAELKANDAGFDPEEMNDEQDIVVHTGSTALAKPGEVRFAGRLKKPYLRIAHGVGGLAQAGFTPGQLVLSESDALDKGVIVYSPPSIQKKDAKPEPAIITIATAVDFWKEVTKFGEGNLPRTWATEEDAIADGMTTKYPPWGSGLPMPNARPALQLDILIREPEDVEDRGTFLFKIGDAFWAPARFICDKGMYTEVITPLTKASYTHGATGIFSATFELSTRNKLTKSTGNYTWVPVLKLASTKTPEQVEELKQVLGSM